MSMKYKVSLTVAITASVALLGQLSCFGEGTGRAPKQ